MRFEQDEVTLVGGVRHGRTLGSPVAIEIANTEWDRNPTSGTRRCRRRRATTDGAAHPAPARPRRPRRHAEVRLRRRPRRARAGLGPRDRGPGRRRHAGQGAALRTLGVDVVSHVVQMGAAPGRRGRCDPAPGDLERVDATEVRCFDPDAEAAMVEEIKAAAKDGDSLGGIVEVLAYGVPVGLGSHVHWDRKLDALLGAGADEHPGGEGRRDRRRVRGRRPAGERGPRPDRLGRHRPALPPRARLGPAASRAACRPASCSSPGRR